ncbi:hypothetical protein FM106_30885 [Brachybacterium faecium]|nr:hypothetical protein FM106_30885 [Brachybacterium faecium]
MGERTEEAPGASTPWDGRLAGTRVVFGEGCPEGSSARTVDGGAYRPSARLSAREGRWSSDLHDIAAHSIVPVHRLDRGLHVHSPNAPFADGAWARTLGRAVTSAPAETP